MKTVLLSPQSARRMNPNIMEDNNQFISLDRETNYFPGCRKDANCNCKMCLDSISATLDLMSMSVQRSSLTKLSGSKPVPDKTPVSIDPTLLSTPTSRTPPKFEVVSPVTALRSTAKTEFPKHVEVKKRNLGIGLKFCRWVLLLGLVLGLEFGSFWGFFGVLRPALSGEKLRDLIEESAEIENLSERLLLIQKSLNLSVEGKISSCTLGDSSWKINQDGLMLISYCVMYQSAAEEVIIWGWPLQTAGLFKAEFASRSFNVLSGRITEWPEGNMIYVVREANAAWVLKNWSASIVQFEPNTWIIEYRRNPLLEDQSILLVSVEFTKFRIMKFMQSIKHHFWNLHGFRCYAASTSEATGFSVPT